MMNREASEKEASRGFKRGRHGEAKNERSLVLNLMTDMSREKSELARALGKKEGEAAARKAVEEREKKLAEDRLQLEVEKRTLKLKQRAENAEFNMFKRYFMPQRK
jgi:hypothetical protein